MVAQMMSLPLMWHKEHIWNFSVLQTAEVPNLIMNAIIILTDVCGAIK
jgi:hypothetical protein